MGVSATPEEVREALRKAGHERTLSSIKTKRGKLGIVRRGSDLAKYWSLQRRKWHHTDAIDEAIRKAFQHKYERRGCVRAAVKATGWPEHAVFRRAVELGLTSAWSEVPWSEPEEELVSELAWQSPAVVQDQIKKRFGKHRTQSSIIAKRNRLKCMKNLDGLTHSGLEEALGVGQRMVDRWLESGKIRGILRFPENQAIGRSVWFFPHWEVRRFIMENLEEIDLARVEKHWFVDLIASGEKKRGDRGAAIAG
jgi:TfoX/Sxy family transcriptional regulator of competence genes